MPDEHTLRQIRDLRDRTLNIVVDSLVAGDEDTSRSLYEIAVKFSVLVPPKQGPEDAPVPIFARYEGGLYEATLDRSRITESGRGSCVWFMDQWMSTSRAAETIGGVPANGWIFWQYARPDGSEGTISEIRDKVLAATETIQDALDEEDADVPW